MRQRSLRQRIALTLTFFSMLVAVPIVLIGEWINERAEQRFWEAMLTAELADVDAQTPQAGVVRHGVLRSYVWRTDRPEETHLIPPEIVNLPPGVSDNIEFGGKEWAVMMRETNGIRTAVSIDISELEAEEETFSTWAIATMLVGLMLLLAALNWLAKRAVEPVTQLSAQLERRPPTAIEPFTTRFQEREIVEVVDALNSFVARIHEHMSRERQFVETMSHELRTPLAVILGALEVLEQRAKLDAREAAAVQRVRQTTKELLDLAQVLLFLSSGSDARIQKTPVELLPLLRRILELFRPEMLSRNLLVKWSAIDEVVVPGVQPLCETVVNNLLRNCCDHASGGTIEIALTARYLSISNAMCNVGESLQGESTSRDSWPTNAGIGLDLVDRICGQLGWTLTVRNDAEIFLATIAFGRN